MWPIGYGQCCFMLLLVLSPVAVRQDVVRTQCASLKFLWMLERCVWNHLDPSARVGNESAWFHPGCLMAGGRLSGKKRWWRRGSEIDWFSKFWALKYIYNYMIYDICGCFDLLLLHCTMRLAIVDKPTKFSDPTADSGICTDFSFFHDLRT